MSSANAAPCVGYESNESSVEPNTFQQRGTLPRPKQAAGEFRPRSRAAPMDTARLGRSCNSFRYPGWRSISYRESRLPWATVSNAFGVPVASRLLANHVDLCITTRTTPQPTVKTGLRPRISPNEPRHARLRRKSQKIPFNTGTLGVTNIGARFRHISLGIDDDWFGRRPIFTVAWGNALVVLHILM